MDTNTGWAAGYNGISKTTDGGTTWEEYPSGTSEGLFSLFFTDANTGWATGASGTILKTTNGGMNWSAQTSGSGELLWGSFFINANTGWTVGTSGTILKTTDGGTTWNPQTSGVPAVFLRNLFFINANTGWTVGSGGTILKTTDGGATWNPQTSGTGNGLFGISFKDSSNGWATGAGGIILKTTDGGSTWSPQTSPTTNTLNFISVSPPTGLIVGSSGTILMAQDIEAALPVELVSFTAFNTGHAVRLTWNTASENENNGFEVQRSNNGMNWKNIGFVAGKGTTQGQSSYTFTDRNPLPGISYYRLKQVDFDGSFSLSSILSIETDDFRRIAVFPNPSKGVFELLYDEPLADIKVRILNSQGETIYPARIYNNRLIDLTNQPNGVYYIEIKAGINTTVEKVVKE